MRQVLNVKLQVINPEAFLTNQPEYPETYTVDTRFELVNQLSPDSLCQCGAVYVRVLGSLWDVENDGWHL